MYVKVLDLVTKIHLDCLLGHGLLVITNYERTVGGSHDSKVDILP